jgi:hypothetical protein
MLIESMTFDDMHEEDEEERRVLSQGKPFAQWTHLPLTEKQEARAVTYSQRIGEDPKARCLQDSVTAFAKHFKTKEKNMSIAKWISLFADACRKGTLIAANGFGRQLRYLVPSHPFGPRMG